MEAEQLPVAAGTLVDLTYISANAVGLRMTRSSKGDGL